MLYLGEWVGYKVLQWPSVGSGRQAGRSGDELSVSSLVFKSRFLVVDLRFEYLNPKKSVLKQAWRMLGCFALGFMLESNKTFLLLLFQTNQISGFMFCYARNI
jgi:hypothetical protein